MKTRYYWQDPGHPVPRAKRRRMKRAQRKLARVIAREHGATAVSQRAHRRWWRANEQYTEAIYGT